VRSRLLLLLALSALAAPPRAGTAREQEPEQDARVENPVRFPEPAAQMRKLAFLVGSWEAEETWEEPRRYKRGAYDGYPASGGVATRTIQAGPGGFSLVWEEDSRNPMGHVTAKGTLSWDPVRRVYLLDRIHSAFPGTLRLTGRLSNGDLVFRGEDTSTGKPRPVRLAMKNPGPDGWTETLDAAEGRGTMKRVVTSRFRKKT
jgi:hypothetical protein